MSAEGRSCPLSYRYTPAHIREGHTVAASSAYVVGGLYGNTEALRTLLDLHASEHRLLKELGMDGEPALIFSGDFNSFNAFDGDFQHVNEAVVGDGKGSNTWATAGNVEVEIAKDTVDADTGCGCAYPPYVDDGVVARSNEIIRILHQTARRFSAIQQRLSQLPKHVRLTVEPCGRDPDAPSCTFAVVHGDTHSLAGWSLGAEEVPSAEVVRRCLSDDGAMCENDSGDGCGVEFLRRFTADCDAMGVSGVLSTHTCLPVAVAYKSSSGAMRVLFNNGSAGMPNFSLLPLGYTNKHQAPTAGVITRVAHPSVGPTSLLREKALRMGRPSCVALARRLPLPLYSALIPGRAVVEAIPLAYDRVAWLNRFLSCWPIGSPAHVSYFSRMVYGPKSYGLREAVRGLVH
ncbi:unnamed protein product [Vitrella brassicaformis CCMP3155]|uniref:Uncharacterized protein n=2 Tax=Vitrella brassicaformis TaxID=1169539 RepID=A0A0G4H1V8_VITBC|nr:unnamed protein product [Vitrella brassicaformis CCMP3155]|eukprot:CEM37630.1 unnamed protein product [Vitrella brassicaformis CCMP3155]